MENNINNSKEPLLNINFVLQVDVNYELPCKKVTSFSQEIEYETIQEGGVNDYVQIRKKPVSKPFTFEIERYVGENYYDPLWLGRVVEEPILLYVKPYGNSDIHSSKRIFCFSGCTVIEKSYGEVNAETAGLLTETTKIAYQTLKVMKDSSETI